MCPASHVQPLRNPFQLHSAFPPQPQRYLHLLRIARPCLYWVDKRWVMADSYRGFVRERDASHVRRNPSSVSNGSTAVISGNFAASSRA